VVSTAQAKAVEKVTIDLTEGDDDNVASKVVSKKKDGAKRARDGLAKGNVPSPISKPSKRRRGGNAS